jgi:UDP:flavonoid glycosyltransferase YjiC (YdhE family)
MVPFNFALSNIHTSRAGVPQVILPQWTDCYDYAQRVELLGIGRLGNRKAKPQWSAQELSKELLSVLIGAHSVSIRQRTAEFAKLCDKNGSGAFVAARTILQECYRTEN